ncbi:MAG: PAS domain-containing protein, partial [Polyangiaceae bacterium]
PWVEFTGAPAKELLGYGWFHLVHPDDREQTRQQWRDSIQTATPLALELRLRAKDANYRWFKLRSVPIRDSHRHVVRWYGTSSEVHDLKVAVEQTRVAADRLSRVVENGSEPFFTIDELGTVARANLAAASFFGRAPGDIAGQPLSDLMTEFGGSTFRDSVRLAVSEDRDLSFDLHFEQPPRSGKYKVRIFPNEGGVAVTLQRNVEN